MVRGICVEERGILRTGRSGNNVTGTSGGNEKHGIRNEFIRTKFADNQEKGAGGDSESHRYFW